MNFETRVGHGNARDLLKAEKGTLSWERIGGGKIRFKTSSWDDPVVTTRSQVLEIVMVDHLPALVKAKPDFHKKTFLKPFHKTAEFCATCRRLASAQAPDPGSTFRIR